MCPNFDPELKVVEEETEAVEESLDDSIEILSDGENEEDDLLDNMVVIDSSAKRKSKVDLKPSKKTKKQ